MAYVFRQHVSDSAASWAHVQKIITLYLAAMPCACLLGKQPEECKNANRAKPGMCMPVIEVDKQKVHLLQGAFRAVLRINCFLFVHHLMFCTIIVFAFQAESIFIVKVGMITSCFATYEFPLYAALIARRTQLLKHCFVFFTISSLTFYLLTRVVQLILLIGLFTLSYQPMRNTQKNIALYWVSLVMSVCVVLLQMYTFVIYYKIWTKTSKSYKQQLLLPTCADTAAAAAVGSNIL